LTSDNPSETPKDRNASHPTRREGAKPAAMEALQRLFGGGSEEKEDEANVLLEWNEYAQEQDIEAGEHAPFYQGAASKFSESFGQMSAAASSSARNLSDSAQRCVPGLRCQALTRQFEGHG